VQADHEYTLLLQEWLLREGLTYPAMPMDGGMPNYFTINGRAYPATDTISMRVGETLKVRFIGSSNGFIHPMHQDNETSCGLRSRLMSAAAPANPRD
jgi:FtsP/CotA-like multicopper oxidase with cupredoxin domain